MDKSMRSNATLSHKLYKEVANLPRTVSPLLMSWDTLQHGRPYRNVYDLLVDVCPPSALSRLQGSAGTPRPTSDYEVFAAVCRAIPQWVGHPLFAIIHELLATVLDCHLPLNQENAPEIWRACAEKFQSRDIRLPEVLYRMGVKTAYISLSPETFSNDDLTFKIIENDNVRGLTLYPLLDAGQLIDDPRSMCKAVWKKPPADAPAYAHALTSILEKFATLGGLITRVELPDEFEFIRPDPFHADTVWKKTLNQERLSPEDHHLLTAQTLRIWGQACVKFGLSMTLVGGRPRAVSSLLSYLKGCDAFPTVTYAPCSLRDEEQLRSLLSTHQDATPGLAITRGDSLNHIREKLITYATISPLGCIPGVDLPVQYLTDLWRLKQARQILCDLLAQWADQDLAPRDLPTLAHIAQRI